MATEILSTVLAERLRMRSFLNSVVTLIWMMKKPGQCEATEVSTVRVPQEAAVVSTVRIPQEAIEVSVKGSSPV